MKITASRIEQIYIYNGLKYFDRIDMLNFLLHNAHIDSSRRVAHFLAQIAHECGEFRYRKELISPELAEKNYGYTSNIGQALGNISPGDGAMYVGRGFIQLTGKHNYRKYSEVTNVDFLSHPEWLERDLWSLHSAVWYWSNHALNFLADQDDVRQITRKINGGYNGLGSRMEYLDRAKTVLDL